MEQKNEKKIRTVIIVLSVLLGISLLALGGTLMYNRLARSTPATVIVPDNLITPDEDSGTSDNGDDRTRFSSDEQTTSSSVDSSSTDISTTQNSNTAAKKAATIELYNKQSEENTSFLVGNMFPGDSETKYFRVRVSYHDKVTVHYKATVRPGYEKLAEVLKVRVKLLSTDEIMYDGLMRDMPESLTHKLASSKSTTDELYYEITAYLDTGTGNAYQNKDLIADFKWWVEETGNLNPPDTGDSSNLLPWVLIAVCAGSMIILLLVVRRCRREEKDG